MRGGLADSSGITTRADSLAILVAPVCFTGTVERFASTGASPAAGDLGQESEE